MKKLIQPLYDEALFFRNPKNNEPSYISKSKINCKLIYSELPEDKTEFIENFNETSHNTYLGFWKKNRGRRYIDYWYDKKDTNSNDYCKRVWEENFIKIHQRTFYMVKNEKDYTLQKLMEILSVNDMIEFMKDRGMTYCPMTK